MAATLPGGGEDRPGQEAMAAAVARAIEEDRHLVVQAGTGTGKSLAYLLPVVRAGRRTVVATATKALQDQLAAKDLPFLAAALGQRHRFRAAVLKGRSNYLCRQRVAEVGGRVVDPSAPIPPAALFDPAAEAAGDEWTPGGADVDPIGTEQAGGRAGGDAGEGAGTIAEQVRRLIAWADHTSIGDRAELEFEPHPRAWAAVSVTARECPGAFRCPKGPDCFAEHARARAAAADVVVVNTHLYATHVASDGAVLPEHDIVVFDEVHALEDVMTAGLGVEMTPGRLRAAVAAARPLLGSDDVGLADGVTDVATRLEAALRPLVARRVLSKAADTGSEDAEPGGSAWAAGERAARVSADEELLAVLELAAGRVSALSGALRRGATEADDLDTGPRRARAVLAASHLAEDLHVLGTLGPESVAWVEGVGPGGRQLALRTAPIEVGQVLAERLWPRVTAVLTSATVPPLLRQRLGLPSDASDALDVGSPFPYAECSLLYCPTDLPDRRRPGAEAALHEELGRLVKAAGGRTLALFTSWRAMHGALDALRPVLPFTVLAQNDLPKPALVEAFAAEESACLFATMSFWQGVDIPGATLSLVVLDRLPFPRPDDPLLDARRERAGAAAFRAVDLPRAATLLAQGAGRLIRSSSDRGVVAVLDRRLATAGYRRVLLGALPPMPFTTDRRRTLRFLEEIATARPGGRAPATTAPPASAPPRQ